MIRRLLRLSLATLAVVMLHLVAGACDSSTPAGWLSGVAEAQYSKQICKSAKWPSPTASAAPDYDQCCISFERCYQKQGCALERDWPRALAPECAGCNFQAMSCLGMAETGEIPDWQCPANCSYQGVSCGASDLCGGVCVSDELCPLLMLRPELIVAVF